MFSNPRILRFGNILPVLSLTIKMNVIKPERTGGFTKMQKRSLWKVALICLSVAVCTGAALWPEDTGQIQALAAAKQSLEAARPETIKVYVNGAVVKPGIYELPKNCRAQEAIAKAGGLTSMAAVDKVNLARVCRDGTQIKVPELTGSERRQKGSDKAVILRRPAHKPPTGQAKSTGADADIPAAAVPASASENCEELSDQEPAGPAEEPSSAAPSEKVNLNTACTEALCSLPEIGPATAARIIEYRQRQPFKKISDLQKVKGIGPAKLKKISAHVTI
jgi:competence protein ComEA